VARRGNDRSPKDIEYVTSSGLHWLRDEHPHQNLVADAGPAPSHDGSAIYWRNRGDNDGSLTRHGKQMAKKRVFISFDYDHDLDLKNLLVGQAKHPDSPFEITDVSIKEAISEDWKKKARERIRGCDTVAVICGVHTDTATGVAAELAMAKEVGRPFFLLWGRAEQACKKPTTANDTDKIYRWSWENLKALIGGSR
jgi:hypothetical protein